jgi:hypothetical protein
MNVPEGLKAGKFGSVLEDEPEFLALMKQSTKLPKPVYRQRQMTCGADVLKPAPRGLVLKMVGVGVAAALLVLGSVLVALDSQQVADSWVTPEYKLDCSFDEERGLFVINVTKARDACVITRGEYYLKGENGSLVPGFQGRIKDIYGMNMNIDEVNLSFMDLDRNTMINKGDQFLIRAWSNETQYAVGREGHILRLGHAVTGECMGTVRLVK